MNMLEKKSWEEFRDSGLLWWINRTLHLFGWAIVVEVTDNGNLAAVYPARCKFRGFGEECESEGFKQLTEYLSENAPELLEETKLDSEGLEG